MPLSLVLHLWPSGWFFCIAISELQMSFMKVAYKASFITYWGWLVSSLYCSRHEGLQNLTVCMVATLGIYLCMYFSLQQVCQQVERVKEDNQNDFSYSKPSSINWHIVLLLIKYLLNPMSKQYHCAVPLIVHQTVTVNVNLLLTCNCHLMLSFFSCIFIPSKLMYFKTQI